MLARMPSSRLAAAVVRDEAAVSVDVGVAGWGGAARLSPLGVAPGAGITWNYRWEGRALWRVLGRALGRIERVHWGVHWGVH